ncbi:MAG: PUA domain-containing protein [Candidatus Hodarchaeota archaeon]
MTRKKEVGLKKKKRIVQNIIAPKIPQQILLDNIHFIAENQEKVKKLIYNEQYQARFFLFEKNYYPTIHFIRENPSIDFPSVQVDQGAVSHVLNGADIFAQGITSVDREFDTNSIVIVTNPQNAVISLGKSLKSSKDLLNSKGKGLLNIHRLGDEIWNGNL